MFSVVDSACTCCTLACDWVVCDVVDTVGAADMIHSTSSSLLGSSSDEHGLGVNLPNSLGSILSVSSSNGVKVPEGNWLGSAPAATSLSSRVHAHC